MISVVILCTHFLIVNLLLSEKSSKIIFMNCQLPNCWDILLENGSCAGNQKNQFANTCVPFYMFVRLISAHTFLSIM